MSHTEQHIPFPRFIWRRRFLKRLAQIALALLTKMEVEGAENIPANGPLIVAANHFHFADPVVILATMPGLIEFIGDETTPNAPGFLSWIRKLWGYILIHRGASSHDGLRKAVQMLKGGGMLFIAPEAGSWAPVLRPARPGVSFLAAQSGAVILPVGLMGLNDIFPSLWRGRRATIVVRYGRPFGPLKATGRGKERRAQLDAMGDEIMQQIAQLIPPEQRGYYAEDEAVRAAALAAAVYPWDEVAE
ncbi:MAG: 1-acyl-sn-glycerol-3-phosphate acyltransferase [Ardenticatenaceae bacterium]|nr:1-acyl-sn-glycerol-3-phosphate acyltransferase [Ardenticatenaceae bacterium]